MQFVIDHTVLWMPHFPEHHLPATPRTPERITTRTGQHALTGGLLRHHAIGPLDQPPQRSHQRGEHPLHFLDLARGVQPIRADAMAPFRQHMCHHPPDTRQRRDLFLLPLFGLVIVVPIPHPLPIVAQDASEGDRGADDVLRQVVRQPLAPSRDLPLCQGGDQASGIRAPQSVDLVFHRARAHPLLQHREEVIRPLFVQPREGEVIYLPPLLLWGHPARGHQDMQMRVPMARAARGLQHHHVTRLQLDLREPRQRSAQHRDPTRPQVRQERAIAIQLEGQRLGPGQHDVAIRYTFVERATDVGHPLIHIHLAAGEAEAALATERHPFLCQAVRAQRGRRARLHGATAEPCVADGLHVAILVPWMTLLEGPPVIADDLLAGAFVDPLPGGGHSAGLCHVLAPRSTQLCTLIRPSLSIVSPCRDGQKGGCSKRKFLYSQVSTLRADFFLRHVSDTLFSSHLSSCQGERCHRCVSLPTRSRAWGELAARTIPPAFDGLHLVIDHTLTRVPPLPEEPVSAATPTAPRLPPRT